MANVTKTTVKKTPAVKTPVKKTVTPKKEVASKISADLFDMTGKMTGKIALPEEIFGVSVNKGLMAQAVRVYLANQRDGGASTKTRSTVIGSTRKIYRQKGTGRARHGAAKAPIFVHGGVAHGPHPKDYSLIMPRKMRRIALLSALTSRLKDGEMQFVGGLISTTPKTKTVAAMLKTMAGDKKNKKILIIVPENKHTVTRSIRNIENVTYADVKTITTYDVLKTPGVIVLKEAIDAMKEAYI